LVCRAYVGNFSLYLSPQQEETQLRYSFEWDPAKAKQNNRRHKITFELATTVFRDINQLSMFDEDHSDNEERWLTLGLDRNGILLVVVHTFKQTNDSDVSIRIISARKATRREIKQYEESNP